LLAPADRDTFFQGVAKTFRWRAAANQTEDPHFYELHLWGPGLDTLVKTRDTSLTLLPFASMQNGQTYRWHVWIRDEFTSVSSQDTLHLIYRSGATTVETEPRPGSFRLQQNYPNPFNPSTTISFEIGRPVFVSLKVYDVLGKEVATLVNETKREGKYNVQWEPSDMPSGIYFYRVHAGDFSDIKKMALIR
jgi:hypothetical protein